MISTIKKMVVTAVLLCLATTVSAARLHPERWYQQRWCSAVGGKAEHILSDRTRVDCLTRTHAIEFDFGDKRAEAIGQALYYSSQTGRKAGIAIIIEKEKARRYLRRLWITIKSHKLQIDVWVVKP